MQVIPHSCPTIGKEELTAVSRVLRSGQLSQGLEVDAFEKDAARRFMVKDAAAVSSGTAALHLALASLKLMPGDEVIIPTYVCTAVLNAVYYAGAVPILADVDIDNGNIDPKDTVRRITRRTRAIVVPHMFGFPADVKAFLKFEIPLIEDCAQSAGAKIGAKPVGSFGRAAVFSFYATKMMAAGEGGLLLSGDKELMAEARDLLSYDHRPEYRLRFNYKMTDIHAALARVQLKKLTSFITTRRKIALEYSQKLKVSGFGLPVEKKGTESAFYRYIIRVKDPVTFIASMKKKGIMVERPLFRPVHYYLGLTGYPAADRLQQESVSLPIYPSLTRGEQDRIIKMLKLMRG